MPLLRTKVVVSRHYNGPEITVSIHRMASTPGTGDYIEVSLSLKDFLHGLVQEMRVKRWTMWWKPGSFEADLNTAADAVVERAKESGVHGLTP